MTKQEFIASIEAKPNFIRWAQAPILAETIGDVEKHHGIAFISTSDGRNTFNVWFVVDTVTGEASWQTGDLLTPEENTTSKQQAALESYLAAEFNAYFIRDLDLKNNWALCDVLTLEGGSLTKSQVLVFKRGSNPISHLTVV